MRAEGLYKPNLAHPLALGDVAPDQEPKSQPTYISRRRGFAPSIPVIAISEAGFDLPFLPEKEEEGEPKGRQEGTPSARHAGWMAARPRSVGHESRVAETCGIILLVRALGVT